MVRSVKVGVSEEAPDCDVDRNEYEWDAPQHEEQRSTPLPDARFPEEREATPQHAEGDHERIEWAQ